MPYILLLMGMLLWPATDAVAVQVSVHIGIDMPAFPELVRVPGYPVYYAPRASANYFFYDGLYWIFDGDEWYASSWYNGPWAAVSPFEVPVYVLRVPVRYYRRPPSYFHGWRTDAAPRWGDRWGRSWEQKRVGWNQWDRRSAPLPAPLPLYQQHYSGNRYPDAEHQHTLRSGNYRYEPRDPLSRRWLAGPPPPSTIAPRDRGHDNDPQYRDPQNRDSRNRNQYGREDDRNDKSRDKKFRDDKSRENKGHDKKGSDDKGHDKAPDRPDRDRGHDRH